MPMTPQGKVPAENPLDVPSLFAYQHPRYVPGVTQPNTQHRRPESVGLYEEVDQP